MVCNEAEVLKVSREGTGCVSRKKRQHNPRSVATRRPQVVKGTKGREIYRWKSGRGAGFGQMGPDSFLTENEKSPQGFVASLSLTVLHGSWVLVL